MTPAAEILDAMQRLPEKSLDAIAPGTSVILAPHADDESLGCGGLIAALCDAGRPPIVVCLTDGTASHPGSAAYPPARLKAAREEELRAACAILGLAPGRIHCLGLPDAACPSTGPSFDAAAQAIAGVAQEAHAATIFTTWRHDPHCDHEAAATLGEAAARLANSRLAFYPVWGWTLQPEWPLPVATLAGARLEIGPFLDRKRRAIAAHATQYSDLIGDDPDGFRLPPDLLAVFERPYEVFLDA